MIYDEMNDLIEWPVWTEPPLQSLILHQVTEPINLANNIFTVFLDIQWL